MYTKLSSYLNHVRRNQNCIEHILIKSNLYIYVYGNIN